MRQYDGAGFDRDTAAAWSRFQARLADRLAEMDEDDVLVVEALHRDLLEVGGAAPYVQFCAWGPRMLRAEASSNHVLTPSRRLSAQDAAALEALGYGAPTYAPDEEPDHGSLNFYLDAEQVEADRLAVMATRALRDVFGVPHPALLQGDTTAALAGDEPLLEPAARERLEEPVATFPHGGHEQLTALVDDALTPYFDRPPSHDADGDIPVVAGRTVLFVRVAEEVPVVEIFGCLATGVTDRARAAFEVNVLNRDTRFVKFRLVEDRVLVDVQLPCWPFVPEHLRAMLSLTCDVVAAAEGDLVERLGARHWVDGLDDTTDPVDSDQEDAEDAEDADDAELEADPEDAGPAMRNARAAAQARQERPHGRAHQVLAELWAGDADAVSPELAASIFGYDANLVLDTIESDQQEFALWLRAREEALRAGSAEALEGCETELAWGERSIALLRAALRVIVERQAAHDAQQLPPTSAAPSRSSRRTARKAPRPRRPRTVPDPTIEEVDPDIWG